MGKVRTRFGIRLSWPITNVATFVIYLDEAAFNRANELVGQLKGILAMSDRVDIADRLIFERS